MECDLWSEDLSALVDGELDPIAAPGLEAHLEACASCRATADRWSDLRRRSLVHAGAGVPSDVAVVADELVSLEVARRARANRSLALRAGWVAAALLVLCGVIGVKSASPAVGSRPPQHVASTVDTYSRQFSQGRVVVPVGATVTWRNRTSTTHELVNQVAGGKVTAVLAPGQSDAVTFSEPGTYEYECAIHHGMKGTVVVES